MNNIVNEFIGTRGVPIKPLFQVVRGVGGLGRCPVDEMSVALYRYIQVEVGSKVEGGPGERE